MCARSAYATRSHTHVRTVTLLRTYVDYSAAAADDDGVDDDGL